MKEIIVIDSKDLKCAEDKNYVIARKEKCKVEKYPTNWEELKELCEDIEDISITSAGDCIEFHGLQFWVSGAICHETEKFYSIKNDVSPASMWQIIKSLIGEE